MKHDLASLYRMLRRIRRVEEEVARIYPSDKIKSPVHLSIGQETVAVGVCQALGDEDVVSVTYRCHAAYLAKGGDLNAMMAELFGKSDGCAKGKGGSMHLVDMDAHVLGASAVVGTNIPIALGWALAAKMRGDDRVVACFFGDGATEEGAFYESLNFAVLHRLPVLFVCENNFYAIHTPLKKRWANQDLCSRVAGFGVPTRQIKDGDVLAIADCANEFVADIRAGSGPRFMECQIYRWLEHVGPSEDFEAGYRGHQEAEPWKQSDAVSRVGEMISSQARSSIDDEIEAEIAAAVEFAETSSPPERSDLFENVYSA